MRGRNCCVKNCRRRSHDHLGRKIPNGLTFHCFPAWRTNEGAQISALTRRRRAAWVAAVSRSNITFNLIPKSMRVCSRHFHSGQFYPRIPVYTAAGSRLTAALVALGKFICRDDMDGCNCVGEGAWCAACSTPQYRTEH